MEVTLEAVELEACDVTAPDERAESVELEVVEEIVELPCELAGAAAAEAVASL